MGNHLSKDCWKLHPELLPDKFKEATASKKNNQKKESHSILSKKDKEELMEMFALAKAKHKKTASKKRKVLFAEDSDSEESLHNLTPTPSDTEEDKVSPTEQQLQDFINEMAKSKSDE